MTTDTAALTAAQAVPGASTEIVVVDDLTRTRIVQYAGASGDYNPLHTDEPYAVQVAGYDSVIAHGMLTMGLTGSAVTQWLGAENLRRYGVRFRSPVFPGDTLTTRLTVEDVVPDDDGDGVTVTVSVSTVNGEGATVLSGTAVATLPSAGD